jgi:hypothetical protein
MFIFEKKRGCCMNCMFILQQPLLLIIPQKHIFWRSLRSVSSGKRRELKREIRRICRRDLLEALGKKFANA